MQRLDGLDGARPVVLGFVDADQRSQRGQGVAGVLELLEAAFGAIEHAGLEEVLRQLVLRVFALGGRQVGTVQQALVHPDGAFHFAAATEQAAQREVQFGGLGIELGHFDESIDGAIGLLIEQEVQAPEIGIGQAAGFPQHLPDVEARGQPAEREQHRHEYQPPRFKIHCAGSCLDSMRK